MTNNSTSCNEETWSSPADRVAFYKDLVIFGTAYRRMDEAGVWHYQAIETVELK